MQDRRVSIPSPAAVRAQLRFAEIRENISSRLWSINQGMSSRAFNRLMDQMAHLQHKFEQSNVDEIREIDRSICGAERRLRTGVLRADGVAVAKTLADTDPH